MSTSEEVRKLIDWADGAKILSVTDGGRHKQFQVAMGNEHTANELARRIPDAKPHVAQHEGRWVIEFPVDALLPDHRLRNPLNLAKLPKQPNIAPQREEAPLAPPRKGTSEPQLDGVSIKREIMRKDAMGEVELLKLEAGEPQTIGISFYPNAQHLIDDMRHNLRREFGVETQLYRGKDRRVVGIKLDDYEHAGLLPMNMSAKTFAQSCGKRVSEMVGDAVDQRRIAWNELAASSEVVLQISAPEAVKQAGETKPWLEYLKSKMLALEPKRGREIGVRKSTTQGQDILQLPLETALAIHLLPQSKYNATLVREALPKFIGDPTPNREQEDLHAKDAVKAIIEEANMDERIGYGRNQLQQPLIKVYFESATLLDEFRGMLDQCDGVQFKERASTSREGSTVIEIGWSDAIREKILPESIGNNFPLRLEEMESGVIRRG